MIPTACAIFAVVNLLQNPSFEDWPDGDILSRHWNCYDLKTVPDRLSKVFALGGG